MQTVVTAMTNKTPTMENQIRHFLLTADDVREFSADHAANVAAGVTALPEYADRRVRYVQIVLQDVGSSEIRVQAAGTCVEFDARGQLCGAATPSQPSEEISRFEYDACVNWTLREMELSDDPTFH